MADTMSPTPSTATDTQDQTDDRGSAVERARDAATEVASDARREVTAVTRDAREQTMRAVHQTREQLRTQANDQARTIASSLRSISEQLTAMGDAPDAGGGLATDVAHQLASSAGRVADSLDSGGVDAAMDDVRRFARNRPVLFLAGALGAGLLVGRLVRATDVRQLVDTAKDAVHGDSDDTSAPSLASTGTPAVTSGAAVPAATLGRQP